MDTEEAWKKERYQKIDEERKKLLAISDSDAEKLPVPERYQRMRFQREIDAAEYLHRLRLGMPEDIAAKARQKPISTTWRQD